MRYRPIRDTLRNRPFPTIAPSHVNREWAFISKEWKSSAVLVLDGDRQPGIFTQREIVFRCVALSCPLEAIHDAHVMTKDPQAIHIDKPFGHALHILSAALSRANREVPIPLP